MGSAAGIRAHLQGTDSPDGHTGHDMPPQLVIDLLRVANEVSTATEMQSLALLHGAIHNGYRVGPVAVENAEGGE